MFSWITIEYICKLFFDIKKQTNKQTCDLSTITLLGSYLPSDNSSLQLRGRGSVPRPRSGSWLASLVLSKGKFWAQWLLFQYNSNGKLKAQSSWVSHMAHQSHGKKSPLETLQRHVLEEKSPIKYLSAFLKYLVCRSHDCAGMLLLSHYCVCMSGVLCQGPGSSPTSGVVTRGASLASLSVVLLSVSESDSELLSESLELPDPPLVGAAGGGWGVANSGLKGKWHHWLPLLLPNWLEKSPGGHEDWSSVRARLSGVCHSISQMGTMRLRGPREWPTVPSCFFFFSFLFLLRYIFSCYLVQKFQGLYRGSDLSYTCSTVLSARRGELNPHFCHRKLRFRGGGFLLQPHS